MKSHPNYGITLINHDKLASNGITVQSQPPANARSKTVSLTYKNVNSNQLKALTKSSTYCTQYVQYNCINAPIFANNEASLSWISVSGKG